MPLQQQIDILEEIEDDRGPPTYGGREPLPDDEPLSFDETVKRALAFCETLPAGDFAPCRAQLAELQTRLSKGRLHFAVLGQFNRGKSTFINALLGIKALPTSVLPLTSVPTVIEYGAEKFCKIRFLDGREDLVIKDSDSEMENALRQYVAEENNPKNRYRVRDAAIACKSELLANGTILIDTPGFGSTHLHNTQTTLDLLIECDAALFLLSADPPMTQTELEFLRLVKERVPKLFFILNKVDLLAPPGLDEVDRFIKDLLCRELGFPINTPLYRTCAIKGESAEKADPADPDWAQSGLEAVREEVLDFMVKEKYFTLSEALSDKYDEAMGAAKALLEEKLNAKLAPLDKAKEDIAVITGAIQALSLELESEMKKSAEEKDALDAKINSRTKENTESYKESMKKALNVLLSDKYFPVEAAGIASTLLPKHANDLGAQLLGDILESANKSIRARALHHTLAYARLQKRYAEYLGGDATKQQSPEELIGRLEISTADCRKTFDRAAFPVPHPQLTDIFRNKHARFEAIRLFYEPLCDESISENIQKADKQARELINKAWDEMRKTIKGSCDTLIGCLKLIHQTKQNALAEDEKEAKPEILFLRDKIKEIKTLIAS
jgi:GTP-binding protein EngB required for normal cell division